MSPIGDSLGIMLDPRPRLYTGNDRKAVEVERSTASGYDGELRSWDKADTTVVGQALSAGAERQPGL